MQDMWRRDGPEESLPAFHRRRLDGCLAGHRRVRALVLDSRYYPPADGMLPDNLGNSGERPLVQDV